MSEGELPTEMFEEPEGFFEEPKTSVTTYVRKDMSRVPQTLTLHLVARHSLWAHCLWNASVVLADLMDKNYLKCQNKRILELGAGAGLPSIMSVLNGASLAVATDYPEDRILENITNNCTKNIPTNIQSNIVVKGYLWGESPESLCTNGGKFDMIILSDLIFNHSEHHRLLDTCKKCKNDCGEVLVAFSHHRPWMAKRDMNFFQLAATEPYKFSITHLLDQKMPAMFVEDPGDENVRSTVHLYRML